LVSLSKEHGESHREEREGTPDRVAYGVLVKWKEVPVSGGTGAAERTGGQFCEAELYRLKGELLLAQARKQ
jgi:hypothetical protein